MRLGRLFLLLAVILILAKLWMRTRERAVQERQAATQDTTVLCLTPEERAHGYRREELFGKWEDLDRDCRNTRAETLEHSSLAPVDQACTIHEGKWFDPYTGDTLTRAQDLDIDHVVPLKEAWVSGAFAWTREERVAFANAPEVLLAVSKGPNREKGDKDPSRWLPPDTAFHREYAARWTRIKLRFHLSADADERSALSELGVTQLPALAEVGCAAP